MGLPRLSARTAWFLATGLGIALSAQAGPLLSLPAEAGTASSHLAARSADGAAPAIRLVEQAGAADKHARESLMATFPRPTSSGQLLVLAAAVHTGTSSRIEGVRDSGHNHWTRAAAYGVTGHYSDGEIWYAENASSTRRVTIRLADESVVALQVAAFSGVASAAALDASTGTSARSLTPSSGPLGSVTPGDLVVGFVAGAFSAGAVTVAAPGYNPMSRRTGGRDETITGLVGGYQVLPWTAATAYGGTLPSAAYWAAGIVAFRAAVPPVGSVTGTVTDPSGTPIAGASVTDSAGTSATTDSSGAYALHNLVPGSHSISAAAAGYITQTQTALVTAGGTAEVSFSLVSNQPPPGASIRAAFQYPWYPETWTQGSHYTSIYGQYDSADPAYIKTQVAAMTYAHIDSSIDSWLGPGSKEDSRIQALLDAAHGTGLTHALYYEREGYGDPTPAQIASDMTYASRYFADPSYLRVNGEPVVFVYGDGLDGCDMTQRWIEGTAGMNIYLNLKVFPGYLTCPDQPASWHQYSGAAREDHQGKFALTISPGFWKATEATPRLARDPLAFAQAVRDMIASGAKWQLIISFNEYVEGTQVEATTDAQDCTGYGTYLTILHEDGNPGPC